jgi:hypothetical protein
MVCWGIGMYYVKEEELVKGGFGWRKGTQNLLGQKPVNYIVSMAPPYDLWCPW